MSEEQPRAEWIFPEEKKSNKGRIWLIVALGVVALVLVILLLFLFLPRGDGAPGASPSPSASHTAKQSPPPTPTATVSPTATSDPEPTPITTPPPVPDPDRDTFAGKVQPWLDDASTGLAMVAGMNGQDAAQVVDTLQGDADRLSEVVAPSSFSEQWYSALQTYATRLTELRAAVDGDGSLREPVDSASAALEELRTFIG